MSKLSEIAEGFIRKGLDSVGLLNKEITEKARKRFEICVSCDKFEDEKTCTVCGCFMPAKVFSKAVCPKNKWE